MAFNNTYNFTDLATSEANWNFTDPRGTGLQNAGTAGRWSWSNTSTPSTNVGPDSGQGDVGYVYTEMTSTGANGDVYIMELDTNFDAATQNISFSYYFGYRGDGNNGNIQLQSNENGAGWVNRGPAETLDQAGTGVGGTFQWLLKTVDLTGLISGNSTRFRLVITQGSAGTFWHKDVGVDTVNVVGTDIDNTPPVITLLGSTPVNIEVGDTYNDAGATASDNVDGNITANIVTVNPVNTSSAGTYIVTYNVSDSAGNNAIEVTRTVNVNNPAPVGAYTGVFDNLNADHHYVLETNAVDRINASNGTNAGGVFTGQVIAQDTSNSYVTNGTGDRIVLPDVTTINDSDQTSKTVCGWFMVDSIQPPPKRIYGEGGLTNSFQFIMAYGNNVMFEIFETNDFLIQIYGPVLEPNRPYHLCATFDGNSGSNIVNFYVDGVLQELAEPLNRIPDSLSFAARGEGEFGDPVADVPVGGDSVLLNSTVNGFYSHWAMWGNSAINSNIVREQLFERGTLTDITITSDTLVNMQAQIDSLSGTIRPDYPCSIRIEEISGGGDFTLEFDNIQFDDRVSIHVQYIGFDELTIRNINGSNTSITSVTNGGVITIIEPVSITVNVIDVDTNLPVDGARVLLLADSGGDLPLNFKIIDTNVGPTGVITIPFDFTSNQPIKGVVRKGTSSIYYKQSRITGSITSNGLNQTVLLIPDE